MEYTAQLHPRAQLCSKLVSIFEGGNQILVLNDSTTADVAVKRTCDSKWLPLQLKTAADFILRQGKPSSMDFSACLGYDFLILCWNVAADRGVLLDGTTIDKDHLYFTFANVVKRPYFVSLVDRSSIVKDILAQLAIPSLQRFSETSLRWHIKCEEHIKELIGSTFMMAKHGCTFVSAQNSRADMLDANGARRQLKSRTSTHRWPTFHLVTTLDER